MPQPNEISSKEKPVVEKAATAEHPTGDSAHHSFFKELANSALYSGLEQPALGVSQFANNDAMNSVKKAFSSVGIEKPNSEKVTASIWYAQTIGGAIGMVLPYALTKIGLGKLGVLGKVVDKEGSAILPRTALALSVKESAITGFTYGTLFTPSDESTRKTGLTSFLADRGASGVGSAATFATLTATSFGMQKLASAETIKKIGFGIAPALNNKIVAGALSGLPSGFVSSEYDSLSKNHTFASKSDIESAVLSMGIVGASFGAPSIIKRGPGAGTADGTGRPTAESKDIKLPLPKPAGTLDAEPAHEHLSGPPNFPLAKAIEPPAFINPNEFKPAHLYDQNARVELSGEEQDLWRQIQSARTPEQFRSITGIIEEHVPPEKESWFNGTLEQHSHTLSDAELNTLWPALLQSNPHQAYRIAKSLGPERTTRIWQHQAESLPDGENPGLANELAKTLVHIESDKQLKALQTLLEHSTPPPHVELAPALLAKENQLQAAQILVDKGITPLFQTSANPASVWLNWGLGLEPGAIRDSVMEQIHGKIAGSKNNPASELNKAYKTAEGRLRGSDYTAMSSMLKSIEPKPGESGGRLIRETALRGINPTFISRMIFSESDWSQSDKIADQNAGLIRALAVNSKFEPTDARSQFLSDLMSVESPKSAEQIAESIVTEIQAGESGKEFILSPGDIKAIVEHGPQMPPDSIPSMMANLRTQVLSSFGLDGDGAGAISLKAVISLLTLADSLGRANPDSFDSDFKQPIEAALSNSNFPYARRLEASRVLGKLQREGFDSANNIVLPELRMTKLVELTSQQQNALRTSVEKSLFSRDALKAQLGDGALGRLLPSIFGDSSEGGIVGRVQHKTHDSSLDTHILDVVDKAGKDPEFARLLHRDQVNVLWASLLHDVGKRENMVDLDHNWASASIAWGVLRTLGYPDSRIQRITDIMSRDEDLSFNPNNKNSTRFSDQRALDNVINSYRHADALRMVAILNRADIKSVKANEAWWTPAVADELSAIQKMASDRVAQLNRNLLPVLPSELPRGFGAYQISDYSVLGHASRDLTGQLLKQRATIESPEYSMSVSLLTPESRNLYDPGAQQLALVTGPFEHIAQANRTNLSTGTSVGWAQHVQLVDNWSQDSRAKSLAQEAESRLAQLGIPAMPDVAPENFPRLAQLRRVLGQFDNSNELQEMAGADNPYVHASNAITQILTHDKTGSPLNRNNEIKLNNPIVSGIGLLRRGSQPIYFEGTGEIELQELWRGNVPDFVSAGAPGLAPPDALSVTPDLVAAARKHSLPIVVLNDRTN